VFVIGTKVGPTSTTKNTKRLIAGFDLEEFFSGSLMIEDYYSIPNTIDTISLIDGPQNTVVNIECFILEE
jgi:hypothetical protein